MKRKIILVSGVSGAGKTTISNILEDLGFYCIDNFPSDLIDNFAEYIEDNFDSRFEKIIMTTSLYDFEKIYLSMKSTLSDIMVILVNAQKEVLLNRYKFTRRVHPLLSTGRADTLDVAINMEKEMLSKLYDEPMFLIDTSDCKTDDLRIRLEDLTHEMYEHSFGISFESFGFKHGIAKDADMVLDVRFLDNPFYEASLKELNGNDEAVYKYVIEKENARQYLKKLTDLLDYIFNIYEKEGKRHITISVGCTGGKHRSVSVAKYLNDYYKKDKLTFIRHRDIDKN